MLTFVDSEGGTDVAETTDTITISLTVASLAIGADRHLKRMAGGVGSMSRMVREALDRLLAERAGGGGE